MLFKKSLYILLSGVSLGNTLGRPETTKRGALGPAAGHCLNPPPKKTSGLVHFGGLLAAFTAGNRLAAYSRGKRRRWSRWVGLEPLARRLPSPQMTTVPVSRRVSQRL